MRKIIELTIDDFIHVIPSEIIEEQLGKRETKHFWKYMEGQTMRMLKEQTCIYAEDLIRFLKYRKKGLAGKNMPLDD